MDSIVTIDLIKQKIYLIRGQKVMLDVDLAELYGAETKVLLQAVKRNPERFPSDFMFQLDYQEDTLLRSQFVTLKKGRGQHRKYLPYVLTENGVAMLSSVLHSQQAIQVNIAIMRAFVKLRELISSHKELAHKLKLLENRIEKHDEEIAGIFSAIRQLMTPPEKKKGKIGFRREQDS